MLTQNEISTLNLSATKKDFVQIWNELLEVAGKLSERWDPTSTNESDPGIVILKALTGIADRLNYNIDKNTLEAFMPTAAQEDSMRKLCDMMGYNIKYYRSATVDVTIKYHNSEKIDTTSSETDTGPSESEIMEKGLDIPKFTVITNGDQDISYFTINHDIRHIKSTQPVTIPCMEGQIVKCESINDNNVITVNQISERNRFYLPETQIAENGIFIYNAYSMITKENGVVLVDGDLWTLVDNLNIQESGSKVYKFGFDSYESRPYIEFPSDYSKLFNEGIFIYYTRTSGSGGGVSPKTLTKIELPSTGDWSKVSAENFSVENIFAANPGSDIETIQQAYNSFKKTAGTFDTLVTCRDYMNKIYSMTLQGKLLVSNVLVTDIRDDLNRAVTICSCDDAGIFYKETSLTNSVKSKVPVNMTVNETVDVLVTKPFFDEASEAWYIGDTTVELHEGVFEDATNFEFGIGGDVAVSDDGFYTITQNSTIFKTKLKAIQDVSIDISEEREVDVEQADISHFDLVLYPFKSYNQIKNNVVNISTVYDESFKYSSEAASNIQDIFTTAEDDYLRTISHTFVVPRPGDILSINNYLKLNAVIATNFKVTSEEGVLIIDKIKIALANAFNMHELDFGEAIPFESIVNVIENADSRIKLVSLVEPALYTTFSVLKDFDEFGKPIIWEYAVASSELTETDANNSNRFNYVNTEGELVRTFDTSEARQIYNKLAVRNVLAGRVPLFNYNTSFSTGFSEKAYQITTTITSTEWTDAEEMKPTFDNPITVDTDNNITYIYNEDDKYTKIFTPSVVMPDNEGNDINVPLNLITDLGGLDINKISTKCEVSATKNGDNQYEVSDLTLAPGEFIKFRAPNFITTKTYPAYVNYHLELNTTQSQRAAKPAEADSLFNLLNKDTQKWENAFDYFKDNEETLGAYIKTGSILQTISGGEPNITGNTITITINNNNSGTETLASVINRCGCIKLDNTEHIVLGPIEIDLKLSSPYITKISDVNAIKDKLDSSIAAYLEKNPQTGSYSWEVALNFEYISFEPGLIEGWKAFVREKSSELFGFEPVEDNGVLFWQVFGTGYPAGKSILSTTSKLLEYKANANASIRDVYIAKTLGSDQSLDTIENDTEYELVDGEYLYIEYTPATTTEEGSAQPVTEIWGPGTIIRPKGFENLLCDTNSQDVTPYKKVTFKDTLGAGPKELGMLKLGVNEQIEIRDYAKVELTGGSSSTPIYIYKNFINDDLERGGSSYELKDGEYIFYTDENKTELAYFTTGTQVTLRGNVKLKRSEAIDLAVILDTGISAISDSNWQTLFLSEGDKITFTEFQYRTLGAGDTLEKLVLADGEGDNETINEEWRSCASAEYKPSGAEQAVSLPEITLAGVSGNGWEVCSVLELDVSPEKAQTLRNITNQTNQTNQTNPQASKNPIIKTSLVLSSVYSPTGTGENRNIVIEPPKDGSEIYFQTNVSCQTSSSQLEFDDIHLKPQGSTGFTFKIFAKDEPAIVESSTDTLISWDKSQNSKIYQYFSTWKHVSIANLLPSTSAECALRLPINLLPNTYGIFTIYLQGTRPDTVWIEAFKDVGIDLLNRPDSSISKDSDGIRKKIYLKSGINCVKISNTNNLGEIFIKTSDSNGNGTLLFDELKLVNSTSESPNGLNIDQLGYLPIEERAQSRADLERQLLSEIRAIDKHCDFYYTAPTETSIAIELNNSRSDLNTLRNSLTNYDINNINNNFVISKLDINYLNSGLKIAQSSKLS